MPLTYILGRRHWCPDCHWESLTHESTRWKTCPECRSDKITSSEYSLEEEIRRVLTEEFRKRGIR